MPIDIRIQAEDFDQGSLYRPLAAGAKAGAVVTFVGRVRESYAADGEKTISASSQRMWLEHYPGMTEKVLKHRTETACKRWPLLGVSIVHRVGDLAPGEQIVFVGVSAPHRRDAFEACQYLMDFLKTEAPFWKREGEHWVEAKASDEAAARIWESDA